jgi:HEAT repeat protein
LSQALLDRLRDASPAVRVQACGEAAEDPSAVLWCDAVGELLADPDREVRRAAARALVTLSAQHPEADTLIRRKLRSPDRLAREGALEAARRLGPPEPGWLPVIVEAMASRHGDLRWTAAHLLVELGRSHGEVAAVPAGLATQHEDPAVRRMAIFCVLELAPEDPSTRAVLEDCARDPDREVRHAALLASSAQDRRGQRDRRGQKDKSQKTSASSE